MATAGLTGIMSTREFRVITLNAGITRGFPDCTSMLTTTLCAGYLALLTAAGGDLHDHVYR
jgi:hypothetical protein